jgi:two-component system chemotaxis sensor kinase CheA
MARNSADHGMETPEERRALGKPEKGTIRLSACHEGGHIIIEIADDGRGLNTGKIRTKAIANGLASEAEIEKMSEAQVHKFIFAAGFSTAAQVTSVSGRGVGLDVVRTNIDVIGGTIDVTSVPCEGARFIIKIPLTLAIVSALIVETCGNRFAIPQLSVVELVRVRSHSDHRIERIKDTPVLRLRDKLLPLIHLKKLLKLEDGADRRPENGFIVVTQVGSQTFGIVVDGVFHTEEIVVKPMSTKLRHIAMFSGNTILGDGSVIMIIDPTGIAREVGTSTTQARASEEEEVAPGRGANDNATSLLIFHAGSAQPKAVPLSLVTRIEEIDAARIEVSCGRHLVQYRGSLMPLVTVNPATRIRTEGVQPLLVFSEEGRAMGLVVDRIIDIVEDTLNIEVASDTPGVLGSAVIRGQATEVLDVGHYLPLAFEDWLISKDMNSDLTPRTLLFVDDSAFFRNMLTPVLKAAGYNVTTVARAEDALACLRDGRAIDALVTDIEMPGMNGYELAEAVRGDPRTAGVPIIALSSVISPEAVERGRKVGFHEYVAKFDRPGLIAALRERLAAVEKAA